MKSAYYITLNVVETEEEGESSEGDSKAILWNKIWHLNIPEKIKFLAWQACVNGLPTKVNLQIRGISNGVLCPGCDRVPESISHALIECEVAKECGIVGKIVLLIWCLITRMFLTQLLKLWQLGLLRIWKFFLWRLG